MQVVVGLAKLDTPEALQDRASSIDYLADKLLETVKDKAWKLGTAITPAWYYAIGRLIGEKSVSHKVEQIRDAVFKSASSVTIENFGKQLDTPEFRSQMSSGSVAKVLFDLLRLCAPAKDNLALETTKSIIAQLIVADAFLFQAPSKLDVTLILQQLQPAPKTTEAPKATDVTIKQLFAALEAVFNNRAPFLLAPAHLQTLAHLVSKPAVNDLVDILVVRRWHEDQNAVRFTLVQASDTKFEDVVVTLAKLMWPLYTARSLESDFTGFMEYYVNKNKIVLGTKRYFTLLAFVLRFLMSGQALPLGDKGATHVSLMLNSFKRAWDHVKCPMRCSIDDLAMTAAALLRARAALPRDAKWADLVYIAGASHLVQLFNDSHEQSVRDDNAKSAIIRNPAELAHVLSIVAPAFDMPDAANNSSYFLQRLFELVAQAPGPLNVFLAFVPAGYNVFRKLDNRNIYLDAALIPNVGSLTTTDAKRFVALLKGLDETIDPANDGWFLPTWIYMVHGYVQSFNSDMDVLLQRINRWWASGFSDQPASFAELTLLSSTITTAVDYYTADSLVYNPTAIVPIFKRILTSHPGMSPAQDVLVQSAGMQNTWDLLAGFVSLFNDIDGKNVSKRQLERMAAPSSLQDMAVILNVRTTGNRSLTVSIPDMIDQCVDRTKEIKHYKAIITWIARQRLPAYELASGEVGSMEDSNGNDPTLAQLERLSQRARSAVDGISVANQEHVTRLCSGEPSRLFNAVFQYRLRASGDIGSKTLAQTADIVDKTMGTTIETLNQLYQCTLAWNVLENLLESFQQMDIRSELDRLRSFQPQNSGNNQALNTIQQAMKAVQLVSYLRHIQRVVQDLKFVSEEALKTDADWKKLDTVVKLQTKAKTDNKITMKDMTNELSGLLDIVNQFERQHYLLVRAISENYVVLEMFVQTKNETREKFENLSSRLNVQLQHDIKSASILNSVISCHAACVDLLTPQASLRAFMETLRKSNANAEVLNNFINVKSNAGLVQTWLSGTVFSSSQHALLRVSLINKSGHVRILLRRQSGQRSSFEIRYQYEVYSSTDQGQQGDQTLDENAVEDHRRQLTFHISSSSSANAAEDADSNKTQTEAREHLKLLNTIDKVVQLVVQLEHEGHPEFQEHTIKPVNSFFALHGAHQAAFEANVQRLQKKHVDWQTNLKHERTRSKALSLFSHSEISVMLALLRPVRGDGPEEPKEKAALASSAFASRAFQNDDVSPAQLFALCLRSARPIVTVSESKLRSKWPTLIKWYESDSEALRCLGSLLHRSAPEIVVDEKWLVLPPGVSGAQMVVTINDSRAKSSASSLAMVAYAQSTRQRLPHSFEVLWCKDDVDESKEGLVSGPSEHSSDNSISADDIRAFFTRVSHWRFGLFFVVHPNLLRAELQKVFIEESRALNGSPEGHGEIVFVTAGKSHVFAYDSAPWLRSANVPVVYDQPTNDVVAYFNSDRNTTVPKVKAQRPHATLVLGTDSYGKSHYIKNKLLGGVPEGRILRLTINDVVDRLKLSKYLLAMRTESSPDAEKNPGYLVISVSYKAQLHTVNRVLFDLLVLGAMRGEKNGLICALPSPSPHWRIIVEWPNEQRPHAQLAQLFASEVCAIDSANDHKFEVTDKERLVATVVQGTETAGGSGTSLHGLPRTPLKLVDDDKCREILHNAVTKLYHAGALTTAVNRLHTVAFVALFYQRVRLFANPSNIGQRQAQFFTVLAKQLRKEVDAMMVPSFSVGTEKVALNSFVIFDAQNIPMALYVDWEKKELPIVRYISDDVKTPPPWIALLAHAFSVQEPSIEKVFKENKFVLVPDYALRLLLVHQRRQSRLPLIIESDTGVGKTFLLTVFFYFIFNLLFLIPLPFFLSRQVYAALLNEQVVSSREAKHSPQVVPRLCIFLRNLIKEYGAITVQITDDTANERFQGVSFHNNFEQLWKFILSLAAQVQDPNKIKFYEGIEGECRRIYFSYPLLARSSALDDLFASPSAGGRQVIALPVLEERVLKIAKLLVESSMRELLFRLLIHPGIDEHEIERFMAPIIQLAHDVPEVEPVVFFDEVNTASILGLFKELLVDRSIAGRYLPENIFFIAAINPKLTVQENDSLKVGAFNVHDLPKSLDQLKWKYGTLDGNMLELYIAKKIAMVEGVELDAATSKLLTTVLFHAHSYYLKLLETKQVTTNAVSQRDIQRVFKVLSFYCKITGDIREAMCMAIASVYYFRLPLVAERLKNGEDGPSRPAFSAQLTETLKTSYDGVVTSVLGRVISNENFVIPAGVALNQALQENMLCVLVSVCTTAPGSIIGNPGTSKTLSIQLVAQNMKGEMSQTKFCRDLPRVDPFFCQCSVDSEPHDISSVLDRAIERQKQQSTTTGKNRTQAVVFMDEASLPSAKRMVLKVLHPYLFFLVFAKINQRFVYSYLDECKVPFIAISNEPFDPANANRMMQVLRTGDSEKESLVLALGCLGIATASEDSMNHKITRALCAGWKKLTANELFSRRFHQRDFIYMLRHLQRDGRGTISNAFNSTRILQAIERNFSGIPPKDFELLVKVFFDELVLADPSLQMPPLTQFRNNIDLLREALSAVDPTVVAANSGNASQEQVSKIRPRFKLIFDPTEDDSGARLLFDFGLLNAKDTDVIHMSDFADDDSELYRIEMLSKIKHCMEVGRRLLLVRTTSLHGGLYDVFNQNFTTVLGEEAKGAGVYSMIAIGARTEHCLVHPQYIIFTFSLLFFAK